MIRILPYLFCEKKELEIYFAKLAERGWFFSWRTGILLGFRKGKPQEYNYEIRYRNVPGSRRKWRYRDALAENIFVYCYPKNADDGAHNQFDAEEITKKMKRYAKIEVIFNLAAIIFFLSWSIIGIARKQQVSISALSTWCDVISILIVPTLLLLLSLLTVGVRRMMVFHTEKERKKMILP